jgi:hypothetical protein
MDRPTRTVSYFKSTVVFWAAILPLSTLRGADGITIEQVRLSHRAAVQSIHTQYCRFAEETVQSDNRQLRTNEGEYWRTGNTIYISQKPPGFSEPMLQIWSSNSKTTSLVDQRKVEGGRNTQYATIVPEADHISDLVWGKALFLFLGPQYDWLTLDELLTKPHKVHECKILVEDGRQLVLVRLSHEKAILDICFDPAANYLVQKIVVELVVPPGTKAKGGKGIREVTKFKEVNPGLFFPDRVEVRQTAPGQQQPRLTHVHLFSDVQINGVVPDSVFMARLPAGIEVLDSIQNKKYTVEPDGTLSVRPGETLAEVAPLSLSSRKAISSSNVSGMPKKNSFRIISLIVIGLIGIGTGLWLILRKQRRKRLPVSPG